MFKSFVLSGNFMNKVNINKITKLQIAIKFKMTKKTGLTQ